ncbi:MAG: A/G-specific adenine glycosylase [Mariprofundales bacterium]|nr:A/G-specific adenine glycosylase [Mariprofundales bacterium]
MVLSFMECDALAMEAVLVWYRGHARSLPWRQTRDPYRVWISEVMLQQTQVTTVLPRYAAWLAQFPDLASLAVASEETVLKAWEGLGYYRRARLLHRAAQQLASEHRGVFPADFAAVLALPGIGRSTAGAILSSCFEAPYAVLDANVKRVLTRWYGVDQPTDRALWSVAQMLIAASDAPREWNQAMMELGACVCRARQADCAACPLIVHCRSAHAVEYVPRHRAQVKHLHWRLHLYRHPQYGVWLQQRPADGIWGGLWTPPIEEVAPQAGAQADLIHALTHRRLHLYAVAGEGEPPSPGRWMGESSAPAVPVGIQRVLALAEQFQHPFPQ